jgi:hypothetical protein
MKILKSGMVLVFGLVASLAFAQMGMHQGMGQGMHEGMGQGMHQGMHARLYDPSTVTTVKGTVVEVQEGSSSRGMMGQQGTMMGQPGGMMNQQGTMMGQQGGMMNQHMGQMGPMGHMSQMGWMGTHLELKTANGPVNVVVGPSSYLAKKNFSFAKGDQIQVTGSKVTYQGQEELIAREVKKGNKTLTLRNDQGIPMWSRSRQRSSSKSGS